MVTTWIPKLDTRFGDDNHHHHDQSEETTTIVPVEEESETPTTVPSTTEETTIPTTPMETTTFGIDEETTINNQHALFFLEPWLSHTKHVQNGTNNVEDTPSTELTFTTDSLTTLLSNSTSTTIEYLETTEPNKGQETTTNSDDLMGSEDFPGTSLIRFPTENEEVKPSTIHQIAKVSQNPFLPYADRFHHDSSSSLDFEQYLNSRGADLKGNDRFVFKNNQDNLGTDPKNGEYKTHANHDRFQSFNRRNRDKNNVLWSLPPSWSESSPQKPIVLRFSRRSGNSRHLLEEHFGPKTDSMQSYYREVPTEDFSYIFGLDPKHMRKRNRR